MTTSSHAVLIRSGALGDFILTLPLIAALRQRYSHLTLVTRRDYWRLIEADTLADEWIDIDSAAIASLWAAPEPQLAHLLRGADLFAAWRDDDNALRRSMEGAAVRQLRLLESRPVAPPHIAMRLLRDAGIEPPADLLDIATLPRFTTPPRPALWLHPGSGSHAKNAPPAWFAQQATTWHEAHGGDIIVSLGEADLAIEGKLHACLAHLPCDWLRLPSLPELRHALTTRATHMIGNDSGVTHLAASLGIPVTVVFRCTDPQLWRPIGPDVTSLHLPAG